MTYYMFDLDETGHPFIYRCPKCGKLVRTNIRSQHMAAHNRTGMKYNARRD